MKKAAYPFFVLLWAGLLACMGLFCAFFAPREATAEETENRTLAAAPVLSAEALVSGRYGTELETWLSDHVPFRRQLIFADRRVRDVLSVAGYEDALEQMGGTSDALSAEDVGEEELKELLRTPEAVSTPRATAAAGTPVPDETPALPETDLPEAPVKNPEKPAQDPEDWPDTYPVHLAYDGRDYDIYTYRKDYVLAFTKVLDRVAALLPEDGTLVFTMVPSSKVANRYVSAKEKTDFSSAPEALVEAFGARNVHAVSTAAVLEPSIRAGEYVWFRTDMHWTPLGTYKVYREMIRLAGFEPVEWDDFDIRTEERFLGTAYRDEPSDYLRARADQLDILSPKFPVEFRRITSPGQYTEIPFLNDRAPSFDRYSVYLGGPNGPWTYAECDNGKEDRCLVITDSFGLAFVPMAAQHYGQVHYYDPRYFDERRVGATPAEMIERYHIRDVFVIVGDLHSYHNEFILRQLSSQLGD